MLTIFRSFVFFFLGYLACSFNPQQMSSQSHFVNPSHRNLMCLVMMVYVWLPVVPGDRMNIDYNVRINQRDIDDDVDFEWI